MNLGIITKPNVKGQVVIPKKYREELGIDENMLLQITVQGGGIYLSPLEETLGSTDSRKLFLEVLKKTAGSWRGDDWPKTAAKRRKLELQASQRRKKAW